MERTENDLRRRTLILSTQKTIQHARFTRAASPGESAHRLCNAAAECRLRAWMMDTVVAKSLGRCFMLSLWASWS